MIFFVFNSIKLDESNENRLVLRSITAETAGRFRCEVSAEAPSFETVSGHADMSVVRKCHYTFQSLHYAALIPLSFVAGHCCVSEKRSDTFFLQSFQNVDLSSREGRLDIQSAIMLI